MASLARLCLAAHRAGAATPRGAASTSSTAARQLLRNLATASVPLRAPKGKGKGAAAAAPAPAAAASAGGADGDDDGGDVDGDADVGSGGGMDLAAALAKLRGATASPSACVGRGNEAGWAVGGRGGKSITGTCLGW